VALAREIIHEADGRHAGTRGCQTGKSTPLRSSYPRARVIDLLAAREFVRFSRDPGLLGEEIEASKDRFVVIGEIQKVPALLA